MQNGNHHFCFWCTILWKGISLQIWKLFPVNFADNFTLNVYIYISLEKGSWKTSCERCLKLFFQDSLWIYSPRHIIIVSTLLCSRVYSTKLLRLLIFQKGSFQVVYNFNFHKFAMTGSTSQGPFKISELHVI